MSKPIEPGCLALVTRDEDAGMTVTCEYYCPPGFVFRNHLGLRRTTIPAWATTDPDGVQSIRAESSLLRIDGGDPDAVEVSEDREVLA